MKRVTPYNTGKVRIGLAHHPTPRLRHDRDAERLQSALLNSHPSQLESVGMAVMWALVAVMVSVLIFIIATNP